jgi:hypothetical protein
VAAGVAVLDDLTGVHAAVRDRGLEGPLQVAVEPVEVLGLQLVRGCRRVDLGSPQRLVRQQVPDAGEHRLVQQPRLDRGPAPRDAGAEVGG